MKSVNGVRHSVKCILVKIMMDNSMSLELLMSIDIILTQKSKMASIFAVFFGVKIVGHQTCTSLQLPL